MKRLLLLTCLTIALAAIGLFWVNGNLFAQDDENDPAAVPDSRNLPFIDRDGDGVPDAG